jgi:DNA-binding response OmpR family regulator
MGSEATTTQLAPILVGNYRVVVSSSLANARAFLARLGVDVIVTDMDMPDAVSICREAKALRHAPAVLVTTAQVERVPDALEARCDGVLLKPFTPNLLVARIGRLLRGRGQHARWERIDSGPTRLPLLRLARCDQFRVLESSAVVVCLWKVQEGMARQATGVTEREPREGS